MQGGFGADWFGQFRCLITRANGMPAVANYLRKPGEAKFRAMALDVLQIEDGLVKEITTFDLEAWWRSSICRPSCDGRAAGGAAVAGIPAAVW